MRISRNDKPLQAFLKLIIWLGIGVGAPGLAAEYTLSEAIQQAQRLDPWIEGSELRQQALQARAVAAGALPDPQLGLRIANLPVDSLALDREPMTQVGVELSQSFPRGRTRQLGAERLRELGIGEVALRAGRRAEVAATVAELWMEVYLGEQTLALIRQDRPLFLDLVAITRASYATGSSGTRQSDLAQAQLELTRLDERLVALQQMLGQKQAQLSRWLPGADGPIGTRGKPSLVPALPGLADTAGDAWSRDALLPVIESHPEIRALEQRLQAADTAVDLARQSYRPQWRVSAGYGYRAADPTGRERPDMLSAGVQVDLPLWPKRRQDPQVEAAVADEQQLRTERALALRGLLADLRAERAHYRGLAERAELYRTRLLGEAQARAEASLAAYTAEQGNFAEAVRARIAVLNTRIEALQIEVALQQTVARINYILAGQMPDGTSDDLQEVSP